MRSNFVEIEGNLAKRTAKNTKERRKLPELQAKSETPHRLPDAAF